MTLTWSARAAALNTLLRDWPVTRGLVPKRAELADGGALLRGYVECDGWGWREVTVFVPDVWLTAEVDLVAEVRALFRAARQREDAKWQSQVLEA